MGMPGDGSEGAMRCTLRGIERASLKPPLRFNWRTSNIFDLLPPRPSAELTPRSFVDLNTKQTRNKSVVIRNQRNTHGQ